MFKSDAVFLCKLFESFVKIQTVIAFYEFKHISRCSAAEACKYLFAFGNNKRRCLFVMKRANALVVAPRFFEGDNLSYDINDITPAFNFFNCIFVNRHSYLLRKNHMFLFDKTMPVPFFIFKNIFTL